MAKLTRPFVIVILALCAASAPRAALAGPAGETVRGIRCDQMEGSVFHIHQHVTILNHGKPVAVPEDVGRPIVGQCLYWLHTHTPDGLIHIEAPLFRSFALGDFFAVWGEPLSRANVAGAKPRPREHVAVWVNGRPFAGDPAKIELVAHQDITIEVGPPYTRPAPFTDWRGQ